MAIAIAVRGVIAAARILFQKQKNIVNTGSLVAVIFADILTRKIMIGLPEGVKLGALVVAANLNAVGLALLNI